MFYFFLKKLVVPQTMVVGWPFFWNFKYVGDDLPTRKQQMPEDRVKFTIFHNIFSRFHLCFIHLNSNIIFVSHLTVPSQTNKVRIDFRFFFLLEQIEQDISIDHPLFICVMYLYEMYPFSCLNSSYAYISQHFEWLHSQKKENCHLFILNWDYVSIISTVRYSELG